MGGISRPRLIEANGVSLCTEVFGDPRDPAVLLVMGTGASLLWWEEDFCRLLADGGRFVIRYDHRDTGRSTSSAPGRPAYTGADLVADAAGVLDAYSLPAAHLVGVSAGGAFAQVLGRDLPPPTDAFGDFVSTVEVDWSDAGSVVAYLVAYTRLLAGDERARDFATLQNHDLLRDDGPPREPLFTITAPTLVIHGTADPLFPLAHGEALADAIRSAWLLRLVGAGHGLDRRDDDTVAAAILEHTARA